MTKNRKSAFVDTAILTVLVIVILCLAMRIGEMDFSVAYPIGGDNLHTLTYIKSIQENGLKGLFFNERIGAPEVSTLIDYPLFDFLLAFEVRVLCVFFDNAATIAHLVYIFSFLLSAFSMYFLLRYLSLHNRVVMIGLSIIYSLAPYHFRRLSHLTLANYFILPLGIMIAAMILKEEFRNGLPVQGVKKKFFVLLVGVVGLGNVYYSFYSLLIILLAVLYKAIEKKSFKIIRHEGIVFIEGCAFFMIGLLPKLFYAVLHGKNAVAGVRTPQGSEVYALKIIQMFVPQSYSESTTLANLYHKYTDTAFNVNENVTASLGLAAILGFVFACIWFVFRYICRKNDNEFKYKQIMDFSAFAIFFLILWGVGGGIGTIFCYLISPQIRANNRVSILIAAFSLMMLGIGLELLAEKVKKRYIAVGFLVLFCFSLYADVEWRDKGWQTAAIKANEQYEPFFAEIEAEMEQGDMIYQLPFSTCPNPAMVNDMSPYAHLRGYLYTDNLKWSYGGTVGRNTKAKELLVNDGVGILFVNNIQEAGFKGVYIDTDGFADGGEFINTFYQEVLGLEPLVSVDSKLYFYKLDENVVPMYETGTYIEFAGDDRSADYYVLDGLSTKGTPFSWLAGNEFCIQFKVNSQEETGYIHALFELYRVYNKEQRVEVYVNDAEVLNTVLQNGDNLEFDFAVPEDHIVNIRICLPDAVSPLERGESQDARALSLAVMRALFTNISD